VTDKKNEQNDPSTRSTAYRIMEGSWHKIQDILGGTEVMRSRGEIYLPRHERESSKAYDERRKTATLLNMTELTLNAWVGKPFSEAIQLSQDMPDEVRGWLDNVDLQGNDATTFARAWMREGLAKHYSHVLIDFPLTAEPLRNALDGEGLRPFMSHIPPENLIFATAQMIDGHEVLTHARILETEMERVGFTEVAQQRIRVFDRVEAFGARFLPEFEEPFDEDELAFVNEPGVFVTVYKRVDKKNDVEWVIEQPPRRLAINEIPLVTFYATPREEFMVGKPPLEDLVDLNINWWQSNSDQNTILTVTRFPILAGIGVTKENSNLEVGPKRMMTTSNQHGDFKYVEHTGAAIDAGRQNLMDLEEQMTHYGAEFTRKRPRVETATARIMASNESSSHLEAATISFEDAFNTALSFMGKWMGLTDAGRVEMNHDFGPDEVQAADLQALGVARQTRDISRKTHVRELQRRNVLAVDFDEEDDAQALAEEALSFAGEQVDDDPIDPQAEE